MKKLILAVTILAVTAAGRQTAKAGDREWAVVGKVLTGAIVVDAIAHAVKAPPAPVCRTYTYAAPGRVYCPPPRIVYAPPAPRVVYRMPVYVAPARVCYATPMVSVRVAGGHHHFRHGCR